MILLNEDNFKIYALDNLLLKPTNLYNEDGKINENCKRTYIGQLHYELKVLNKKENIILISDKIIDFLNNINEEFDIIMPIPSKSNDNIKKICEDISNKTNILLLDNIKVLDNDFIISNIDQLYNKKILLIDDTFKTGKTLKNVYNKIKHNSIHVVALTFVVNR